MRQITTNIYKFEELSRAAKDNFKTYWREHMGYDGAADAKKSFVALINHFDGRLQEYSMDWNNLNHSSVRFIMPEMSKEEIAARLNELGAYNPETLKGLGDCKLTGYFMDEEAIDGFRIAFCSGEHDLTKLMKAAFKSWKKAAKEDYKWQLSDECLTETAEANEWEFTEDGQLF